MAIRRLQKYFEVIDLEDAAVANLAALAGGKQLDVAPTSVKIVSQGDAKARNIKFAWQPRFHEHIIRKPQVFKTIMDYVDSNVRNWPYDRFNENHANLADAPWRIK